MGKLAVLVEATTLLGHKRAAANSIFGESVQRGRPGKGLEGRGLRTRKEKRGGWSGREE